MRTFGFPKSRNQLDNYSKIRLSENIVKGSAIKIDSKGQARTFKNPGIGSALQLTTTGSNNPQSLDVLFLNEIDFVVCINSGSYGYLQGGTLKDGIVEMGALVQLHTTLVKGVSLTKNTGNSFLCMYADSSNNMHGRVCSINNKIIETETPSNLSFTIETYQYQKTVQRSVNNFTIAYTNNSQYLMSRSITISGTTVSAGSAYEVAQTTNDSRTIDMLAVSGNEVLIGCFNSTNNAYYLYLVRGFSPVFTKGFMPAGVTNCRMQKLHDKIVISYIEGSIFYFSSFGFIYTSGLVSNTEPVSSAYFTITRIWGTSGMNTNAPHFNFFANDAVTLLLAGRDNSNNLILFSVFFDTSTEKFSLLTLQNFAPASINTANGHQVAFNFGSVNSAYNFLLIRKDNSNYVHLHVGQVEEYNKPIAGILQESGTKYQEKTIATPGDISYAHQNLVHGAVYYYDPITSGITTNKTLYPLGQAKEKNQLFLK